MKPIKTAAEAAQQKEDMAEAAKQLRLAYGRVFGTPDGQRVLADLQARFGWKDGIELPCFTPGLRPEDAIHRDGMKEPVRHISRMIRAGEPNQTEQ